MTDRIPEFYQQAIHHVFHDVVRVTYPSIRGQQNNLMFIETPDDNYVVKFGVRDIVLKNRAICKFVSDYGIRTPNISVGEYNGAWFECYPMIAGKTLFEYIQDGMPTQSVKRAFDEILTQFAQMEKIPTQPIIDTKCSLVHKTAYEHAKNSNGVAIANMVRTIVYLLNRGHQHNTGLYHTDLTPKNVMVDKDGGLISFLDMDSMAICDRSFAFGAFADKWVQAGFNLNELYDKYEAMTGCKINRARINAMLRTVHTGKALMYHAARLCRTK